jgi:SAM-dependent methyltransferase
LVHVEREEDTDGKPEDDDTAADVYASDGTVLEGRDPRFILGRRLLKLGKVNYRHIETMPEWLQLAQKDICSHRTAPQIRRCLDKWMLKSDRELQDKYRVKRLGWKRDLEEGKTPTVITYGPEETVAYAHYFLPARFALTKRVLEEVKLLLPQFQPRRVLDFGCGPATAGAAVAEVWKAKDGNAFEKYTGVDISRSMLDAAKGVMTTVKGAHGTDSVFWDKSAEVVRRAELKGERFDLVIASYSLVELSSDAARRAATQLLFELVDVNGLLLIVESGNPQGSHAVRTARQLVLDSFNAPPEMPGETKKWTKKRALQQQAEGETHQKPQRMQPVLPAPGGWSHEDVGAFTVSPCTHDKPCPLSRGAWCSFSQRVHSGMIRKASEEKFSYVVLQKRVVGEVPLATSRTKKSMWDKNSKDHLADLWIAPGETGNTGSGLTDGERDPTPLRVLERFMDADEEALPGLVDELVDKVRSVERERGRVCGCV